MKKMTTIIFAFLLLFQCSTVYGKGTLYDKDSFSSDDSDDSNYDGMALKRNISKDV